MRFLRSLRSVEKPPMTAICRKMLVPDEGIEPPTNGLQNRCSTAELIRHFKYLAGTVGPAYYRFTTEELRRRPVMGMFRSAVNAPR